MQPQPRSILNNLMTALLSLAILAIMPVAVGGIGVSASANANANRQTPPTTTPQPAKPILLTDPVPDPKQQGVRWFAPTGHTLRGEFIDYWTRYGGLEQFGYPLTEEFFEGVGSENKQYRVQYFERNRFEHHPENMGTPYEVLLGTLGREFQQQDPPATPLSAPAVYYRETGHNLSGAFKAYWDTHGGLFVHGYPITEELEERSPTDGKVYRVQYFERSRFEYHPENKGTRYEVLLGLLGRGLAEKKGYPYGWYPPFGRAVDFSWVSGQFHLDPRFCTPCGCRTVRYVQNAHPWYSPKGTHIRPIGPVWESYILTAPLRFGVVFGRANLADLNSELAMTETCEKPPYIVERIQSNPAR